ncbi:MAG: hypothetical protein IV090_17070 [Candidatus Sericytochromatia bacterium]|nr:hypothetical protein [Candidatus Sericytochromatia bacterium]
MTSITVFNFDAQTDNTREQMLHGLLPHLSLDLDALEFLKEADLTQIQSSEFEPRCLTEPAIILAHVSAFENPADLLAFIRDLPPTWTNLPSALLLYSGGGLSDYNAQELLELCRQRGFICEPFRPNFPPNSQMPSYDSLKNTLKRIIRQLQEGISNPDIQELGLKVIEAITHSVLLGEVPPETLWGELMLALPDSSQSRLQTALELWRQDPSSENNAETLISEINSLIS